jgi:hypothetical protein
VCVTRFILDEFDCRSTEIAEIISAKGSAALVSYLNLRQNVFQTHFDFCRLRSNKRTVNI